MDLKIDQTAADRIRDHFLDREQTIAVAESVTAGLLQYMLSGIPDGEQFFQGGITAYNIGQKYRHLNVEPIHAKRHNCVSDRVAAQMAREVCTLFSSDWGIGITGYATPVEQSGNQLFCYFAICREGEIVCARRIECEQLPPQEAQEAYCREVINQLVGLLSAS